VIQELGNIFRTADWNDGDALRIEIPSAALREGFDCALVADPFDKDNRTRRDCFSGISYGEMPPEPWLKMPTPCRPIVRISTTAPKPIRPSTALPASAPPISDSVVPTYEG
jgi:hypothetical protein